MAIRKSGTKIELDRAEDVAGISTTAKKSDTLADEGLEERDTARNYEDE